MKGRKGSSSLLMKSFKIDEHSEINEIGQREYDERDGKDNTRARQCKLHKTVHLNYEKK